MSLYLGSLLYICLGVSYTLYKEAWIEFETEEIFKKEYSWADESAQAFSHRFVRFVFVFFFPVIIAIDCYCWALDRLNPPED